MKLKLLLTFLSVFILSGCAEVGIGYLTEQGIGQLKIQWNGVENEKILADPIVPEEIKKKIILVGEYKKFFYFFFNEKASRIYTKTTTLEHKAVSYLVIASPHNKIEPHEFHFPFVGAFPYIGFFDKNSAKDFSENLQQDNFVTWIRPVYAYSTLGYLEDRILSSFFHYDEVELAELVFHELFHTIFFVKDDVDLNENLANLYGREMLKEYFKERKELQSYIQTEEKIEKRNQRIVELIDLLKEEFNKMGGFLTDEKADILTNRFVSEVFRPEVHSFCEKIELDKEDCKIDEDWNQASFAAFMTYEEQQDFLGHLKQKMNLDLKQFLVWLRNEQKIYSEQNKFKHFTDYLKAKVTDATLDSH
jgi:predicted aminopeptidase